MRLSKTLVAALALTALGPFGGRASGSEESELARQLRSAASALLSAAATGDADRVKPMAEILGVSARVAERAELPRGVATGLAEALARLRKGTGPFPDPGVGAALDAAYAALHGGRRFTFPAGIESVDQARDACLREIDGAAAAVAAGRREDATKGLLEFLMLLTTPMEAH